PGRRPHRAHPAHRGWPPQRGGHGLVEWRHLRPVDARRDGVAHRRGAAAVSAGIEERERFERAIAAIDAANADDPTRIVVRGVESPKELAHAELMTEWIHKLRPDAGETLLLAARAHHIRMWTTPRSDYPDGRSGYLRWRTGLHKMHADEVG